MSLASVVQEIVRNNCLQMCPRYEYLSLTVSRSVLTAAKQCRLASASALDHTYATTRPKTISGLEKVRINC